MRPVSKRGAKADSQPEHKRSKREARRAPRTGDALVAADRQWLRVRESLLRQLKEQVSRRLGPEPEAIRSYARRWEREMRAPWKVSGKDELIAAVERADLVFGGDFHAFAQAQKTHLKILEALPTGRQVVLALEAFAPRHQALLDAYVSGRLPEGELLRRSRWKAHWGFPWENYRPLAEFARERGARLLAVGSSERGESLKAREFAAARALRRFVAAGERPEGALVYMVFGDLHLASGHLPKVVEDELQGVFRRAVTVHLNPERLYFALARKGLEGSVDVLRLGADRFCVLASPPWVQWQSYLMYLEDAHDAGLDGDDGDGIEWTDHVDAMIRLAAHDLGLGAGFGAHDFTVVTAGDRGLWPRLKAGLNRRELNFARHSIQGGRSFFIPRPGIFFLARPTINHAAELAGHYIHWRLSGMGRPLWRLPGDFQALIWSEAVGFFISKLVNHKRHAETLTDLRLRLAVSSPRDQGREALMIAIEQRLSELLLFTSGRRRAPRLRPRRSASWLDAARILGGMMGERLYLAYRSRKISKGALLSLLRLDPSAVRQFNGEYESIVRRLGPGTGAPRTRKERL